MKSEQLLLSKIENVVKQMAERVFNDGTNAIKPGNNGPYYNVETNVRNLAHWSSIFAKYYIATGDESYKKLVVLLADDILVSKHYNGNGVYKCREVKKGDEVNGVIGPAWIIEGLINAYMVTRNDKYYDRALKLYHAVPFNDRLGIWNRRNTKNEKLSVDATFNHQLWFAAAGAMINHCKRDNVIEKQLERFVSKLPRNMTIRKNGRIGHFTMNDQNGVLGYVGKIYRDILNDIKEALNKQSLAYKETGYHAFNLYGFAILKEYYDKDIAFLSSKRFRRCLEFACSENYCDMLMSANKELDATKVSSKLNVPFNVFSFAYNSPIFELLNVYKSFNLYDEHESILRTLSENMLKLTYDDEKKAFCNNTDDSITLTARVYEALPFIFLDER